MKNQNGLGTVLIVFIITIILVIVGIIYLLSSQIDFTFLKTPNSHPVPSPSSATSSVTINSTANWQTYENSQYHYQLKYPADWTVNSKDDQQPSFIASLPTPKEATGDYTPGDGWLNILTTLDTPETITKQLTGIERTSQTTVDGTPSTEVSGRSGIAGSVYFDTVLFEKDGYTYEFTLSTQDATFENEFTQEFHRIISTFSFIKKQ